MFSGTSYTLSALVDGALPGDVGFDPLGFSDVFDIKVLREAELKHGRIAMLATLGLIVQELYTFPFFDKVSSRIACVRGTCLGATVLGLMYRMVGFISGQQLCVRSTFRPLPCSIYGFFCVESSSAREYGCLCVIFKFRTECACFPFPPDIFI